MNFQQYTRYYGAFHGVSETEVVENCIVYKLEKVSWAKSIVLKLKTFQKAFDSSEESLKPLSNSLMKHFKLDTPRTVFKTDDSFSILYGNTCLVYPKSDGPVSVVASEYFVNNFTVFQNYMMKLKAERVSENTYYYKSSVFFLDDYDIPYPGCDYFSIENNKNSICRICFIMDHQDIFRVQEFVRDLENENDIYYKHMQTKCVTTNISNFIDPIPTEEIFIPTTHYEYTNTIIKKLCFKNPSHILHDIINSHYIFEDIGIVIEYPICLSYTSLKKSNESRRYYCFAINCHKPKQFLFLQSPYDRYYQYNYGIKDVNWTPLYYDPIPKTLIPEIRDVVLDTNIIGYIYRNTFFCLSHPKLSRYVENRNTEFLLNTLSFDIEEDDAVNIVYMHRFDFEFIIYCVKHKALPYDMWCLKRSKDRISNYRTNPLPYLVRNWAEIVSKHSATPQFKFGDLHIIRLMYILARHKICFSVREGDRREIIYESRKDIIFQIEKNAIEFINRMRLDFLSAQETEKEEHGCIIA